MEQQVTRSMQCVGGYGVWSHSYNVYICGIVHVIRAFTRHGFSAVGVVVADVVGVVC